MDYSFEFIKDNPEVVSWVKNIGIKKANSTQELEHVVDYLMSGAAPTRLRKMSWNQALLSTKKWSEASSKKGKKLNDEEGVDIEHILELGLGYRVVKLNTENAYKREGFLMRHCLGAYKPKDTTVYSFRDDKNMPHATFEVKNE